MTPDLTRHLRGVNVLAIESNYCPQRQQWSGRPEALKQADHGREWAPEQRTSGRRRSLRSARAEHVVLLHAFSRVQLPGAGARHEGSDYALTIGSQFESTRWVRGAPRLCPVAIRRSLRVEQPSLFVASAAGQARAGASLT